MANQPTPSFGGNRDPLIRTILRQYRRSELATDDSGYGRFSPKTVIPTNPRMSTYPTQSDAQAFFLAISGSAPA